MGSGDQEVGSTNQSFHDFEHAGWERAAEYYAGAFGSVTSQMAAPLLDSVKAGPEARLLDVACGPGFVSGAAATRGAIVTGLDFSSAMIAEARRRNPSIAFREGDAEALPFPDASFDSVVMNFGMLHLARPDSAIAEARRVLRADGRYAFTVWAAPEQAVGFGMVLHAIEQFGTSDVGLPPGPPFFQFSDAEQTQRTLEAAGFRDVAVRTVPLTWTLSSADGVFDALSRGGVRTAAVLRAQSADALDTIRSAVRREVARYARGSAFQIPMPVVLASAVRLG